MKRLLIILLLFANPVSAQEPTFADQIAQPIHSALQTLHHRCRHHCDDDEPTPEPRPASRRYECAIAMNFEPPDCEVIEWGGSRPRG